MKLFIDTSIFVDVLKKRVIASSKSLFDSLLRGNEGFISSITVAELSVGAHLSPMSDAIEKTLDLVSLHKKLMQWDFHAYSIYMPDTI